MCFNIDLCVATKKDTEPLMSYLAGYAIQEFAYQTRPTNR